MAVWQLTCCLLPQTFCSKAPIDYDSLFDVDGFIATQDAWFEYANVNALIATIDRQLPREKDTSIADYAWGDIRHNDIKLYVENDVVHDLFIRFALGENFATMLNKVHQIAQTAQCCLVLPATKQHYQPFDEGFDLAVRTLLENRPKKIN